MSRPEWPPEYGAYPGEEGERVQISYRGNAGNKVDYKHVVFEITSTPNYATGLVYMKPVGVVHESGVLLTSKKTVNEYNRNCPGHFYASEFAFSMFDSSGALPLGISGASTVSDPPDHLPQPGFRRQSPLRLRPKLC